MPSPSSANCAAKTAEATPSGILFVPGCDTGEPRLTGDDTARKAREGSTGEMNPQLVDRTRSVQSDAPVQQGGVREYFCQNRASRKHSNSYFSSKNAFYHRKQPDGLSKYSKLRKFFFL
jgi:hypothetical protein